MTAYFLPDLGEGIARAEIVEWHVQVGDRIAEEAPMVVVLTDKTTVEIPSPRSGTVLKIHAAVDEVVTVGTRLIDIGEPGDITDDAASRSIPPALLTSMPPPLLSSAPPVRPIPAPRLPTGSDHGSLLRGVRRVIAERLTDAQRVPAVTIIEEVDLTDLEALQKLVGHTFVPFLIQAVVAAAKDVPEANATLEGPHLELVLHERVNVGVATQTSQGLIVPVLVDAQDKSLEQLESEMVSMAVAAKDGKLEPSQLQGGTITVTVPGPYAGVMATPLLNLPQVAVVGLNRVTRRPVVIDEQVVIRSIAFLSMTFDHRAFDGIAAGRFLMSIRDRLADPLKSIRASEFR